jgi:hypothetical protein
MAVIVTRELAKKVGEEDLAHMFAEVEGLSDEEARRALIEEK